MIVHVIVVIPGLKGSSIRLQNGGHRVWPPKNVSLTLINKLFPCIDRTLISNGDKMRLQQRNVPLHFDIIDNVKIFCGAVSYNVYGKFLAELRRMATIVNANNTNVCHEIVSFAYDWRNSIADSAWLLYNFLQDVKKRIKQRQRRRHNDLVKFSLLGHSLGGLVARYYTECILPKIDEDERRQHFTPQCVMCIATPHSGSLDALLCLTAVKKVALISRADSKRILDTFDSVYELLPFDKLAESYNKNSEIGMACEEHGKQKCNFVHNLMRVFSKCGCRCFNNEKIYFDRHQYIALKTVCANNNDIFNTIVSNLRRHFSFWNFNLSKLRKAYMTVRELNLTRKPNDCRYVFVNARGHNTAHYLCPDKNVLYNNNAGDGTVPSNTVCSETTASNCSASSVLSANPPIENVHLKMLNNSLMHNVIYTELLENITMK